MGLWLGLTAASIVAGGLWLWHFGAVQYDAGMSAARIEARRVILAANAENRRIGEAATAEHLRNGEERARMLDEIAKLKNKAPMTPSMRARLKMIP